MREIEINWEGDARPSIQRIRPLRQSLEQIRHLLQVLHVRLLAQQVIRFVRLRTHIYTKISQKIARPLEFPVATLTNTRTALAVEVIEAVKTFLATGAVLQVALAGLRQQALADDAAADSLIASFALVQHQKDSQQQQHCCTRDVVHRDGCKER